MLTVALIGCGSFGWELARLIGQRSDYRIVGVCDRDPARARRLGATLGVPHWTSHQALLADCDCAAVTVQTPHNTHRDIAVAAAAAKRHIFCEKTMATTVADGYDMIEAAEANGVKLMVGHKRRLRPAYAKLRAILDSGVLGRPVAVNVAGYFGRRLDGWWTSKEACGGLQYWAGTHDFDTLRYLFGDFERVYALQGPKVDPTTDYADALSATFRFESGMLGSLQVSPLYPILEYRGSFSFQVVCQKGGLRYDPERIAVEYQVGDGERVRFSWPDYGHEVAFQHELGSFRDWVVDGTPPILTGWDGLRVVEILQAISLSIKRGEVVRLPLPRDEREL
jgi:predicted dehydrogenase